MCARRIALPLTAESRIINRLRAAEGAYVTMAEMIDAVWGHMRAGPPISAENAIAVYVRRLKKRGFPIRHTSRGYYFHPTLWEIADERRPDCTVTVAYGNLASAA